MMVYDSEIVVYKKGNELMKKMIMFLLLMMVGFSFGASYPQRTVNNKLEWFGASGNGSITNPYIASVDIGESGALDVNIQDQHTENISLFLGNHLDTGVTLIANTVDSQEIVGLSFPTTSPTNGDFLCFKEGVNFAQMEIITVTADGGDDYTCGLAMPLDYPFTTNSIICLQNVNMNVDGSSPNVEFFASPSGLTAGTEWDITRMIVTFTHAAAGDDGKYGGIAALATGTYFRVENGADKNLFNVKENADFAIEGYDLAYATRSGGQGAYATRSRITFAGRDKRGVTIRLSTDNGDKFMGVVRDDTDGNDLMRVKIQGHVVE